MGGGNPLGTEGPIIHLSSSLATWLVSKAGKQRRKLLSTFGVIGAAAGISSGFNVLVTGFVYVIEEIARTLSGRLAVILAFAASVAMFVAEFLEKEIDKLVHLDHTSLVPPQSIWAHLTHDDRNECLYLGIPIGLICGVGGWIFTRSAWTMLIFLNPQIVGREPHRFVAKVPEVLHMGIVGVLCGCAGAIAYELTGENGVWGTTSNLVPLILEKALPADKLVILLVMKFIAFVLATAVNGPGGQLVPSLVTGGYVGAIVARIAGANENVVAGCAVMGMGGMFASVMRLPLTGVIIIFELTRADVIILHIAFANFIASNIVCRLPHGAHSFVHCTLEVNATWHKLGHRDFIETDDQEMEADIALFQSTLGLLFLNDDQIMRNAFDAWKGAKGKRLSTKNYRRQASGSSSSGSSESGDLERSGEDDEHGSRVSSGSRHGSRQGSKDLAPVKVVLPSLTEEEVQRRRELRQMWEDVSSVIPRLNWRLWKTLDTQQRVAIADVASAMGRAQKGSVGTSWDYDEENDEGRQSLDMPIPRFLWGTAQLVDTERPSLPVERRPMQRPHADSVDSVV